MNAFIMVVNDVDLDEPMVEEKRKVTSAVINEEKGTAGIGQRLTTKEQIFQEAFNLPLIILFLSLFQGLVKMLDKWITRIINSFLENLS